MPRPPWNVFGRLVRGLPAGDADRVPDAELLARFVKDRDQAAFELLVWRHGAIVLGTCRRVLGDEQLAEDAFQATFLVLARKAGSLNARNIPGWLHSVARRMAVRSAKHRAKRAAREIAFDHEPAATHSPADPELKGLLDAEIARLPDRFRVPVLLCYLQNYTTEEAARTLGVPHGTVLSRLSTARQRLAARLTRRGVALPVTLVSATIASNPLVSATARSAALFAAGDAALTSPSILLATEVLRMSAWKLPAVIAAAMMVTVGVGSGVAWIQTGTRAGPGPVPAQQPPKVEPQTPVDVKSQVELEQQHMRGELLKQREQIVKQMDALWEKINEKSKLTRESSLEDFSAIQQRYADTSREYAAAMRELREKQFELKTYETEKTKFRDAEDSEFKDKGEVQIDPNTRNGMCLQAYYKQHIDAYNTLQQLETNKPQSDPTVILQQKIVGGIATEIGIVEQQIRTARAKVKYESWKADITKKETEARLKEAFLKELVQMLEYKIGHDLKLGILVGGLATEIQMLQHKRTNLENQITDIDSRANRLSYPTKANPVANDRTDEVLTELTKLRKDVLEIKSLLRK